LSSELLVSPQARAVIDEEGIVVTDHPRLQQAWIDVHGLPEPRRRATSY
jgi:hypothetical protein